MSATADLGNIFQMVTILEQGLQAGLAAEDLFKEAQPAIQACFPNSLAIQIYRTTSSGTMLPLIGVSSATPSEIKQLPEKVIKYYKGLWVTPLYHGDDLLGMMDIHMPKDADAEETRVRLELVAWHLTKTLYTLRSERLLRQQELLTTELNRCKSFREIAYAIAKYMLGGGQFCSINEFMHNDEGDIIGFVTIATANRHDSYETHTLMPMTEEGFRTAFAPLLSPDNPMRSLLSPNIKRDETIPSALREWLLGLNIKSCAIFPLHYGERPVGFIGLNDVRSSLDIGRDGLRVFERITDQVSALVQAQNLIAENVYTQDISARQKQAFKDLVVGQDFSEMAHIVARHLLPQRGRFVSLNRLEYDAQGSVVGLRLVASANRERAFSFDELLPIAWGDLHPNIQDALLHGDNHIIHDVDQAAPYEIGIAYHKWLIDNGYQAILNVPMSVDRHPIGVLSVINRYSMGYTREEIDAFVNLADQIAALMYGRDLLDKAQNTRAVVDHLILANRLITTAENYSDMVQAALHTIAQEMLGVALTLFDSPIEAGGQPQASTVAAFNTQEKTIRVDGRPLDDDIPAPEQLEALRNGTPIFVPNLRDTQLFPSQKRSQLYVKHNASWAALFGLRAGDQLLGTLDVLSANPYSMNPQKLDAYVTMADQIGAAIRSRQLLEESRAAQAFATQLVATNRLISEAEGYTQMMLAVMRTVPREIKCIALALFDRAVTMYGIPNKLVTEVIATRNDLLEPRLIDEFSTINTREDPRFSLLMRQLIEGQTWTVKDLARHEVFVADKMLQALSEQGMTSVVVLGLAVNTRLMGVLAFAADYPLQVNAAQLDALRAIVDQVAITLENRDLLRQTADALGFVQSQFETANKIYRTDNPTEMLEAIYGFSGRAYDTAHLAIYDTSLQPPLIRVMSEAGSGGVRAADYTLPLTDYPAGLAAMEAFDVPDVSHNRFLKPQEKANLIERGIGSLLVLPLLLNQRLIGLIYFSNRTPLQIPTNRLRALRSMADQLAVKFENQKLLVSTAESLEEVRILYEANRAMIGAQDTLDMLWALRSHVASDAASISHYIVSRDASGQIASLIMKHSIVGDSEQVMYRPMEEVLGAQMLATFQHDWERGGTRVDFMEVVDLAAKNNPIVPLINMSEVGSYVAIILSEIETFEELIVVSFDAPRTFNTTTRRLFEAVTDQMVVVLQKQHLLRDAQTSASHLASQVRALETLNRLAVEITATHEEKQLLDQASQALVNAMNIDHAGIVLLDIDGTQGTVISEYPARGVVGVKFDMQNDPLQRILRQETDVLLIDNVATDTRMSEDTRALLQRGGVQAMLLLPLVDTEGEFSGSIGLDLYSGQKFTPNMVNIAKTIAAQISVALQNIRLLKEAQTRATQLQSQVGALEMLNELSAIISTRRNEQQLFNDSAQVLVRAVGVDHCGIVIFDESNDSAYVLGEYPRNGIAGMSIDTLTDPVNLELRRTKAAVLISAGNWDVDTKTIQLLQRINAHTLFAIPLIDVRGNMIGSVGLEMHEEGRTFTSDMIALAQTMTAQLAIGLQNVRLLQEAQRRAEQLQRVAVFSQSVQATLDMVSIYEIAVAESTTMIAFDHLNIVQYDTERDQLRIVAQHYRGKTHVDLQNGPLVSIEGTPIGQVWVSRQLTYIPDMKANTDLRHSYVETRSLLVAPIFSRGLVRGAVEAGSQRVNAYNEADAAVFQQMVNQLTIAIENAEAYAQSQKLAQTKALAGEISAKLQRQVEMERMLDIAARELGKALGAKRARIRLGVPPTETKGG